LGASQRNKNTGDERGVNPGPVNRCIENITKHGRESDLEREVDVRWISKRVGNKQPLRLRSIIFSLGRCRQKKPIEHDGQPAAVSESYPEPKGRSNQEVR